MSQQELLKAVVSHLESSGIPYMLTGSFASSIQGEPRMTHDIDLVVALHEGAGARALFRAFPPSDYYLSEEAVAQAIHQRAMFNLIENHSGDKVDFWMLTDEAFDQSRFSRRQKAELAGTVVYVSAPEDTILAKLRWANLSGGSEKQFTDALRIYEVQNRQLDYDYIEHWSVRLDVEALWTRLREEAEIIEP